MRHRLGHAEEQQADAHAGTKKHCEPAAITVLGLGVICTELQVSETTKGKVEDEQEETRNRAHIEPAHIREKPVLQVGEKLRGVRAK